MLVKTSDMPRLNQAELMVQIQKRHGVSVARQSVEVMRLQKGRTALSAYEYYYYNLYDPKLSWEDKLRYAGAETCRAIYLLANDFSWWNAAEDKLAFHAAMAAQGYATPALHAVASKTRRFGAVACLSDEPAIAEWLKSAPTPLFGKPLRASHGIGGIQIASVDAKTGRFTTDAGETHAIADFVREIAPFLEDEGYLFQEALAPHPVVARITGGRVSTLRIVVLFGADGPSAYRIICRMPAGENRVDNFRRPGNLIGLIDAEDWRLARVTRGVGPLLEVMEQHPDTGSPLTDVQLPLVEEAVNLALTASTSFPGIHIQSWDVALGADGPVILEMNPGGNLNLVQLCSGEGALTPAFQSFVRWCEGLKLNSQVIKRDLAMKRAA